MRICKATMLAAAIAWPGSAALAASGAGQAVAVVDKASASGQAGTRTLAAGSDVFVGDTIVTDGGGEAQIRFIDGTRMVVGAGSSLVIDQALFRGGASENKFAVRALGGAFRFISGESGDKGYSIRTPSATIGVRGTAFDFVVDPTTGETKLVLLEGEADMCKDENGKEKKCKTVASPCAILQTKDEDDEVEQVPFVAGKSQRIQEEFPYTKSQDDLEDDFKVAGAPCVLGGLAAVAITGSALAGAASVGALAIIAAVIASGSKNSTTSTNSTND